MNPEDPEDPEDLEDTGTGGAGEKSSPESATSQYQQDYQYSQTLVIGVGNPFRGDDAAGIMVARGVAGRTVPSVLVVEASGEGAALMDCWQGARRVILVDAVQSTGQTGQIHRFDVARQPLPSDFFHYSTHAFSVAEAVELSRVLGSLPSVMVILGIVGESFEPGARLSPKVEDAVKLLTAEILQVLSDPSTDLHDLVKE